VTDLNARPSTVYNEFASSLWIEELSCNFSTKSILFARVDTNRNYYDPIVCSGIVLQQETDIVRLIGTLDKLNANQGTFNSIFPTTQLHREVFTDGFSGSSSVGLVYRDRFFQYWVLLLSFPPGISLPSEADVKIAAMSLCTDYTLFRTEKERVRREALNDRVHKLEATAAFSSSFAHSLNNNLSIVLGYSEMLLFDSPSQIRVHSYSEAILEAGTAATELIEQLLTYRNIASIVEEPIVVSEFLNNLRTSFRAAINPLTTLILAIPEHNLSFKSCSKELPPLFVELCRQVGISLQEEEQVVVSGSQVDLLTEQELARSYLDTGCYVRFSFFKHTENRVKHRRGNVRREPDKSLTTTLRTIELLGGRTDFQLDEDGGCRFDIYFRDQSTVAL